MDQASGPPDQPENSAGGEPSPGRGGPESASFAEGVPTETSDAGSSEPGPNAAPPDRPGPALATRRPIGGAIGRRGGVVVAIVGLAVVAAVAFAGTQLLLAGSSSPSPTATISQPPATASSIAVSTPSNASSSVPSQTTGPTGAETPSPTPQNTGPLPTQTAPTARITFNEVVLDSNLDTGARPRSFSFVSDGPGRISVEIVASAPTDATRVCLSGDGGQPTCSSGATPTVSFYGLSSQSKWTATLASATEASPTIDVTLTWPSNKPSVTVTDVPFEGTPNRDSLRSLTATVTARTNGVLTVEATWPPAPLDATLTVAEVTPSGPVTVDQASFKAASAIAPAHATSVKADTAYRLTLMNQSPAGTPPDLKATIAFP